MPPGSQFASRSCYFEFGIIAGVAAVPAGTSAQLDVTFLLMPSPSAEAVELRVNFMQTFPYMTRRLEKAVLV